jgi:lipopolysaccharide biosynthesis glycosyltransferase
MVVCPTQLKNIINEESFEELVSNYETLGFQWSDQCILNYVVKGKYQKLDSSLNSIPEEFDIYKTKILHFAGESKPWNSSLYRESLENAVSYRFSARDHAFWTYFTYEALLFEFLKKYNIKQHFLQKTSPLNKQIN